MSGKLRIGVFVSLTDNVREEIKKVHDFGLDSCQLGCWDTSAYKDDKVRTIKQAMQDYGVEVTSLWAGYPGEAAWNFQMGPQTIGFVPPETREIRVQALIAGAEFAAKLGVPTVTTHAGFIPENPKDPLYEGTIDALRRIAQKCKDLGLALCFETGQETPITLLRAMKDIGTDHLGVNLDPAHLLMYGKANPVDALDILGPYIKGVHAKDGEYPTDPDHLGVEKPLGEGRVGFPELVAKLKSYGYSGALTIEREIAGDQQIKDIQKAIEVLKPLC